MLVSMIQLGQMPLHGYNRPRNTYIFISHLPTNAYNGHWFLAISTYCHRVNRYRVCMSKQDKHGIQNTRVYMGKQNIAEYN